MNKRQCGAAYEQAAGRYLAENGLTILEYNFRTRFSEIDLIARDRETIVFVEVKYRRDDAKGNPLEAVNFPKQRNICKAADFYRMKHKISEFEPVRFDVVGICGEKITWLKNAFDYCW